MITVNVHDLKHLIKDRKALSDKHITLTAKDVAALLGIKQTSVYIYLRRKGLTFSKRNSRAILRILKERLN